MIPYMNKMFAVNLKDVLYATMFNAFSAKNNII